MNRTTTTTTNISPLEGQSVSDNKGGYTQNFRQARRLFLGGVAMSYQIGTFGGCLGRENYRDAPCQIIFSSQNPLPGELVTAKAVEEQKKLCTAFSLIDDFYLAGFSWSGENNLKISPQTADAAKILLTQLEPHFGLPKIAPNEAEGLMMVWTKENASVLCAFDFQRYTVVRRLQWASLQGI